MFNSLKLVLTLPPHEIEQGAVTQIAQCLGVDVLDKLIVFPDVHQGYDIPIGSTALIDGYIWPGAVGVDINCGMCHINTGRTLTELCLSSKDDRRDMFEQIKKTIPTGFKSREGRDYPIFTNAIGDKKFNDQVMARMNVSLGTLGGGNHFLTISINRIGMVGVTLHTGSRNPGNIIGKYWMARAKKDGVNFNGLYMYSIESELGKAYYEDMQWASRYAEMNRFIIMKDTLKLLGLDIAVNINEMINEAHNTALIQDNGKVLHRKGATPAEKDVLGVIPANMRDGIYITRGLGNKSFLSSASHGAGRKYSRTKAKKELNLEAIKEELNKLDIIVDITAKNLDEGPDAYKDIKEVLRYQDGLVVDIVDHFIPKIVHIG